MIKGKIDIPKLLYEICEDESVYEEDIDLIESGLDMESSADKKIVGKLLAATSS